MKQKYFNYFIRSFEHHRGLHPRFSLSPSGKLAVLINNLVAFFWQDDGFGFYPVQNQTLSSLDQTNIVFQISIIEVWVDYDLLGDFILTPSRLS